MSRELAEKHYEEHRGREYFDRIVSFMCSGKVVAMTIEGEGVIKSVRKMVGKTNPLEAEAGTIRGDYGYTTPANLIHASDSEESAKREINLFF
jgi:nucleoside-diphosphate kinase